jgi:hypothetical protein
LPVPLMKKRTWIERKRETYADRNRHPPSDFALKNFGPHHIYTKSMKKRVDERFKKDMKDACKSLGWFRRPLCEGTAETYAFCVRNWPRNKATDPDA